MNDILADYREWRDAQPVRVSTHSGRCHLWHRDCMIHRLAHALAAEQAKPALTDAERLAIQWVVGEALSVDGVTIQATLRGLLARTQENAVLTDVQKNERFPASENVRIQENRS